MYNKTFWNSIFSKTNRRNFKSTLPLVLTAVSLLLICSLLFTSAVYAIQPLVKYEGLPVGAPRWWKGNLHCHSLWSDGDDFPEMVAAWYKDKGYHFLAISDHDKLQQGQKWVQAIGSAKKQEAFRKYMENFGERWVQRQFIDDNLHIRLKPFNEFRSVLEQSGRFLLIQSEEISPKKAHLNAINLQDCIPRPDGDSAQELLQKAIDAVNTQRRETNQPMLALINHPNFKWRITAEDIIPLKDAKFFEVYNGHNKVRNYGDKYHAGTERMWDIILTKRLAEMNLAVIYGIATDDAHHYHRFGPEFRNPGRGWVCVKASHLTPEYIIEALEAGNFYASTGVVLQNIVSNGRVLHVVIEPEDGVSYTIQFIGTLKGYDLNSRPVVDPNGIEINATRVYSSDIGKVLSEVEDTDAAYLFKGNEIYVRAKVISTKPKSNPYAAGDVEVAWVQPATPKK